METGLNSHEKEYKKSREKVAIKEVTIDTGDKAVKGRTRKNCAHRLKKFADIKGD